MVIWFVGCDDCWCCVGLICMFVRCLFVGGVCGLLCFADLFVGMFDSCLVVFVVMVVYVWLGAFLVVCLG